MSDTTWQILYEPAPVYEHLEAIVPLLRLSVAVSPLLFQI